MNGQVPNSYPPQYASGPTGTMTNTLMDKVTYIFTRPRSTRFTLPDVVGLTLCE